MAFKRSAVRSRLSPPKSLEIVRFRDFFRFKRAHFPYIWAFSRRRSLVCFERNTFDQNLTRISPESGFVYLVHSVFLDSGSKGCAKPGNGIQSDWLLYMQIMLGHIHIGVTHNALNGG